MSRLTVRGFASGLLSALGHNPVIGVRDLAGEARVNPDALAQSSLSLRIRAASLEVQNNASEKDRREMKRAMDEEVLEAARYPDITFETTTVEANGNGAGSFRAEIEGRLTLHGVTRPVRVPTRVSVAGDLLRANGEFSLNQTDYRIQPPSVAAGTLRLKDELKFTFDIVARQKTN